MNMLTMRFWILQTPHSPTKLRLVRWCVGLEIQVLMCEHTHVCAQNWVSMSLRTCYVCMWASSHPHLHVQNHLGPQIEVNNPNSMSIIQLSFAQFRIIAFEFGIIDLNSSCMHLHMHLHVHAHVLMCPHMHSHAQTLAHMCVHMQAHVNNRAVGGFTPYFGLRPNGVTPYISIIGLRIWIIDVNIRLLIAHSSLSTSIIGIKNPILLNLKGEFFPLNPFLTLLSGFRVPVRASSHWNPETLAANPQGGLKGGFTPP